MSRAFPVIDLKGSHFDMGLSHGRALSREIKANLSLYGNMVLAMTGIGLQDGLRRSRDYMEVIGETAPRLLEEMEGVARGAGVSLESVVFLNARTELMTVRRPGPECTAMGLTGARTSTGRPLLAQNWDWHYRILTGTAVFRVTPPAAPRCLYLAEAGQVGKIGLNETGLGVLLNILFCGKVRKGVPVHVLLRQVLEAADVPAAEAVVREAPRASSSHFLLGDAGGNILGLELSPEAVGHVQPVQGGLVHTNHFCDPALERGDEGPSLFPDSIPRIERGTALLSKREQWDPDALKEIFTDHRDGPASICRHRDPQAPEHLRIVTAASIILHLSEKVMEVSCGQPCRNPYRMLRMDRASNTKSGDTHHG